MRSNTIEKKGFTLIELIIVVAIVALLAGAITPLFSSSKSEAQIARVRSDLDAIKTASHLLYADTGRYPITNGNNNKGRNLVANDDSFAGWDGPYLEEWKDDPFDNPYRLRVKNPSGHLIAFSFGPDGVGQNANPGSDDISIVITTDPTKGL